MSRWEGMRTVAVVAACLNATSVPDFALTEVEVTHDEYQNGVLYDRVTDRLRAAGYEEPFVLFDDLEGPAFLHAAVRNYLGVREADPPISAFATEDR